VGAPGRSCGAVLVDVGIDAQIAGFGGTERVVHAVAPGRIKTHTVGRVGGQQGGLGTIEQAGDVRCAGRVAAQ
jgi:hypothetical protein